MHCLSFISRGLQMEEPHTYNIIIYNIIYTYYQIDELYLDLRFELL